MARISRFTFYPFAIGAASTDIEQFGSAEQTGIPNYTTNPATIQALSAWSDGWSAAIVTANKAPYKQDVNAVDFVFSQELCYLAQQGIPEWDPNTTYFNSPNPSVVQYNGGYWYISLQDNNIGNTPPVGASNAFWQYIMLPPTLPTRTILTVGSGTYTLPTNPSPQQLRIRMVGAGGGGAAGETSGGHGGSAGGATTINSVTANGGAGGTGNNGSSPLSGGAGGSGGSGSASIRMPGQTGGPTANNVQSSWGWGGNSILGTGAAPASRDSNGNPGNNYGGGGGAGQDGDFGGGGGGGGEYAELIINNPSASYAYTVGAGGAAGSAAYAGGTGAPGVIIVDEYYF